ncbi:threonine--tRNA ligase [Candidatus Woesearchaeota archaeon]|nr:threonine--tRNA ligase [Candidatus Woesearchaeota archaeon]
MINISFPDGSKKQYEPGVSGLQIALDISEGLARNALCVKVNDKLVDLEEPINNDSTVQIITFKDAEGVELFRHSTAHILAQAVSRLYPEAKNTIGPAVEQGFYYDFDNLEIKEDDLQKIEDEMKKIVKEELKPKRIVLSEAEALNKFKENSYKIEMIKEYATAGDTLTAYEQGEFVDLCRGPHLPNLRMVKAIKLFKVAKAYWKGKAENKQLTRIYGISFPDNKLMKEWVTFQEEAAKRDHRKIGRELKLYSFQEEAPGMPFFHDKGSFIWNKLAEFMSEEMFKRDYEINKTPMILNKSLWLQSGHWDHYKENMYFTKIDSDEENYAVKPMNCPGNILVYKEHLHSYKELPIRAGEFGLVHRHELSGALSGLFRVRCFTQDDAHVFCTREQIKDEINYLIEFVDFIYKTFGFEYKMFLSTKPEKALGFEDLWELAEKSLSEVLEESGKEYIINPGDGAFYGPKIDFQIKDALGRMWQCATIQLDFQMPEKFDLTYEGKDGQKHRPVMLHRAIYGSFERFLGILVEHFAGKFPLWISPNQVKILPIADRHEEFAIEVEKQFKRAGLRSEVDLRSESIKKKVRDAQVEQWNYSLVIGDQEVENKTVNVRARNNEILGSKKIDEFITELKKEISSKIIPVETVKEQNQE